VAALGILVATVLAGALGPALSPYSPTRGDIALSLTPPVGSSAADRAHPLGTDTVGRDVATRLAYGARTSLFVAAVGGALALAVGGVAGLLAGYCGGRVDDVISTLVDVAQSLPTILLALAAAAAVGASLTNVLLVVLFVFWATFARQIRGDVLAIRDREFVVAARALGAPSGRIIARHVVPNVLDGAVVMLALVTGRVILFEGTLSFLGVGVPPPAPSWGAMIEEGRRVLERGWWVAVSPALAMLLVLLAINSAADWLRDRLDPRSR
jgi:peptide/nickel transport system permease protein